MSTLSVIATVFRRPWAYERMARSLSAQTRKPDNIWLMFEDPADGEVLFSYSPKAWGIDPIDVQIVPYGFAVKDRNPLSAGINVALSIDGQSDYFTYLTDDSLPDPRKYEVMVRALDENPGWGVVYCSQDYGTATGPEDWLAGGTHQGIRQAHPIEDEPFCVVDHTQVMHRRTKARWPLDYGSRRLSDAYFWNDLKDDLGPFHGIPEVLDWTRQLPDGLSARA